MSIDKINQLISCDSTYRQHTINLNASENYSSQGVKNILKCPAYDNYTFPPAGGQIVGPWQFNPKPYDALITDHINHLCTDLLSTAYVEPRPKGGQSAEIAILCAFAQAGDSVFYVDVGDGGHFGLNYIAAKCDINLIPVVFDATSQLIDIECTIQKMNVHWKNSKNKLVILGQSFILRKQQYLHFSKAVKEEFSDVILSCDASHTLGLIMGKQFPNPLLSGFDILHASTHKTFPGPQKAIIALSDKSLHFKSKIESVVSPGLFSNCGTSEIYALAYALEELKIFSDSYAHDVCNNAKQFAHNLSDLGLQVIGKDFGFTQTHQVWIEIGDENSAWEAANLLHSANIRTFPTPLPFTQNKYGLRLGTNAMTRRGFSSDEFSMVADFIKAIIIDKSNPIKLQNPIKSLLQEYPLDSLSYTLDYCHTE